LVAYRVTDGDILVQGNHVYRQLGDWGIRLYYGVTASDNVVHDNQGGIYGSTDSGRTTTITGNHVYQNTDRGIILSGRGTVRDNVVYGNSTGIAWEPDQYSTWPGKLLSNLVYGNTDRGIQITNGNRVQLINNTVYQEVGDAVRVEGQYTNGVALRNNILWVESGYDISVASDAQRGFVSDYNALYATGTGKLAWWQDGDVTSLLDWWYEVGQDEHSQSLDPQFVSTRAPIQTPTWATGTAQLPTF
jgi:parallel beta-helix repeat protein